MKALVIYYSRDGHTKRVAEAISDNLACDKEEIVNTQRRSGPIGFLRSGFQVKRKSMTTLKAIESDLPVYDLVIIGTPVWAGTVSVPVRTFLNEHKERLKEVAFFSTHKGDTTQNEFIEMEAVCGKKPVATMSVTSEEAKGEEYLNSVQQFVRRLKSWT